MFDRRAAGRVMSERLGRIGTAEHTSTSRGCKVPKNNRWNILPQRRAQRKPKLARTYGQYEDHKRGGYEDAYEDTPATLREVDGD